MYAPERLIAEMVDDYSNLDSEHSVDDHLDNTDDFRRWVRQKRIGTNLDPENRIPMQVRKYDQHNFIRFFFREFIWKFLFVFSFLFRFRTVHCLTTTLNLHV